MRPEDLIATTLEYEPGRNTTLSRAFKTAKIVAEGDGSDLPLTPTEYLRLLESHGYDVFVNDDGYTALRDTGIPRDVRFTYLRRDRAS
ncbi:hypothetical protein ACIREM_00820 [Streptomyces shenzhenensis]|uniref:hypothetical protein n=1 Tax=Streptomyces shenzhenensis TaxID=943815 RepID=UPI0037F50D7D